MSDFYCKSCNAGIQVDDQELADRLSGTAICSNCGAGMDSPESADEALADILTSQAKAINKLNQARTAQLRYITKLEGKVNKLEIVNSLADLAKGSN